ncbi:RHS repeat-associated protein [Hamadaea flava]|uniref:RHS repeat-associated core domain-containing protein n=1 Tax=Hamadaea flava TaxID=1742688 RepID=A0ABV8LXI6_9ACTN|nr:RHS repeat-associated core domain-containing protein [Hamadaea flava]MCP2327020.1 RHS repeat-associated protein [Hamadaea flava]
MQPKDGKGVAVAEQKLSPVQSAPTPPVFDQGSARELVDQRTETSTTFLNPDGTKTIRMFAGPRYTRDASGRWVDVDTRLATGPGGRWRPQAAMDLSIAPTASDPQLASMNLQDVELGFSVSGASSSQATPSGSAAMFSDVRTASDLKLEVTNGGLKESIILKSASAPTTWTFPLTVRGLTPTLVSESGRVEFRDAKGEIRAIIPPGFMADAAFDWKTNQGPHSTNVHYRLVQDGQRWSLEVSADREWISDPSRKFPVIVDPSFVTHYLFIHDTFVSSKTWPNRDNSAMTTLNVGHWSDGENAATYIRFTDAETALHNKYILGATLNLYSIWALNCTKSALNVYPVTYSFTEGDPATFKWPGPPYGPLVATSSFARGGQCASNPDGYEGISFKPEGLKTFTRWTHFQEPWYGFALRGSTTDSNSQKIFYSAESSKQPWLDVSYSDEGAAYLLPDSKFTPPVTPTTAGGIDVVAENQGFNTWSGSYAMTGKIINLGTGATVQTVVSNVSSWGVGNVLPLDIPRVHLSIPALAAGTYRLRISMRNASGVDFNSDALGKIPTFDVDFQVLPAANPELVSWYPPNNAQSGSLTPSLFAQYFDADSAPGDPRYWFRVCNGTAAAPVGCQESNWIENSSWSVPAGVLSWSKTSFWYVALFDGANMTPLIGPFYLTPIVAQPAITHQLAGANDNADVPGVNPQVGNYSTTVVDASVATPGLPLRIERTYNSQDPRGFGASGSVGAFGPGWTTPLDQRITVDSDGSGNVVATLASGRQLRFGRNADGTYAPPPGVAITLVKGTSTWTLRDVSGEMRIFDGSGNLTSITSVDGLQQQYLYTSGRVSSIKDVVSGRSLYLTWTNNRVQFVTTDRPAAGATQPLWEYVYLSGRLRAVFCPTEACALYSVIDGSHYRSTILDDNPLAYWPLSETSGGTAANVAARKPGELAATYANVTLNQAGALAGTSDAAASFDGTKSSRLSVPDHLTTPSMAFAVELWFKAASGKNGVLYGIQNTALGTTPARYSPSLYVGTDFKLHGKFWTPTGGTQMVSAARVDDGAWHHVVLSVNVDAQTLFLDGVTVGGFTGNPVAQLDMSKAAFGYGYSTGWPAAGTGYFPFAGQLDDIAVYRHPLGPTQVAAHYATRVASHRMSQIKDANAVIATMSYDNLTGRLATLQDRHGATWAIAQPAIGDGTRSVSLSATDRETITYVFDANRGDRLVSRQDGAGTASWGYDANGFVNAYTDANGRLTGMSRDARGNVVMTSQKKAGAWHFSEAGYYLNPANPLDPRNDKIIYQSGTRNAWDLDPKNRIRYDLSTSGRITKITYPQPAGTTAFPTETFAYAAGTEAAVGGGTVPAGMLIQKVSKLGGRTDYTYDAKGNMVTSTEPLGLTTTFTRDLLGRATGQTTSAVVSDTTVTYGTTSTAYDGASRVRVETGPAVTNPITGITHTAETTYTYSRGLLAEKQTVDITGGDPARTWSYTYDTAGRLLSTTTPDNVTTSQAWNTAGDLAWQTQPSGLKLEYAYDDARRLIETTAVGAGVDPTSSQATRLVIESRAYDPAGQLASKVDANGRETTYTYFDDGLLATENRVTRDPQGNITSTVVLRENEYDHGTNLIRVTEAGGIVRDIDYDDAGNVVQETLDHAGIARSTVLRYNGASKVITERQTSGATFVTGRTAETPYLSNNNGSQLDGAGSRYADGAATMTYKFTFPQEAANGTITLEVDNQYLLEYSTDNQTWTTWRSETRDIRDGSNRDTFALPLASLLASQKTIYVRIGDSQPANGWGGALSRVWVEYARATQPAAQTTNTYDQLGRITSTTVDNAGGNPTSLTSFSHRDPRGLVRQSIDPSGNVTDFTYDANGSPATVTEPARTVWRDGVRTDNLRPVTTLGRDTFGDLTQQRDPYSATITVGYDQMSRPTTITLPTYTPPGGLPITATTTTSYYPNGKVKDSTDALNRQTSYTYDLYGRPVTKILPDPDGSGPKGRSQWIYTYDRSGELVERVDPTGGRTSATYNNLGALVTQTLVERSGPDTFYYTTTYGRDDAGYLTSITSPIAGHTTQFTNNRAGEPTKITDGEGVIRDLRYDQLGQITTQITSGTRATSYTYDTAGRLSATADHTVTSGTLSPPLRTGTFTYDASDRRTTVTSPDGRITQYGYDVHDQPTTITQRTNPADPGTAITVNLGYDALGRHTRTVDGNGNATDYTRNSWGLITDVNEPATTAPADRTFTTVYDAAGQPIKDIAPGNVIRTRTFDGLGNQLTETGTGTSAATTDRVLAYDALGRITSASSPTGTITYTWNDRGLLAGTTSPAATATFAYDAESNLTTRTDSNGTTSFTYDNASRTKTITDPLTGKTATNTYNTLGELTDTSYGLNQPSRHYTYNNRGDLTTDTLNNSTGGTVASATLTYTLDGLLQTRTTTGLAGAGTNTYSYDGLGRVTTWTRPDTQQVTYGYDNTSNRTTVTSAAGTRTYTYDTRNRLTSATGGGEPTLTNTWSPRGTLETSTTGAHAITYTNDAFDQTLQAADGTDTITYTYDALGRVSQRNSSAFGYADQTNDAHDIPATSGTTKIARDTAGTAIADNTSGTSRQLVTDPIHGDTTAAVDPTTGTLLASRSYTPYGDTYATTGQLPTGFQGGYTDPTTGLINAHARWYDPNQATFTSRDSLILTPDPVTQTNRYAYGNANPVNLADPSGHCAEDLCLAEGMVLLAIVLFASAAVITATGGFGDAADKSIISKILTAGYTLSTLMILDLVKAGYSAQDIVNKLQQSFPTDTTIQRIIDEGRTASPPSTFTPASASNLTAGHYTPTAGSTISVWRPSTVSATPPGQYVQNSVTPSIAIAIPAILNAEADGSQAQNAVVAGMASAVAASAGGPEDPSKCEAEARAGLLADLVEELASSGIPTGGSPGAPLPRGGIYALISDHGTVMRTGRTNDLKVRESRHNTDYGRSLRFVVLARTDNYDEIRGLEEIIENWYTPMLRDNRAIGLGNKNRAKYIAAAEAWLKRC